MRVFLDTNVLLDVYLKRAGEPGSARVIAACGEPWNEGFVTVHTLSNAFYLIEPAADARGGLGVHPRRARVG